MRHITRAIAAITTTIILTMPLPAKARMADNATLNVSAFWEEEAAIRPEVTVEVTDTTLPGDLPVTYKAETDTNAAGRRWHGRKTSISLRPFSTYHVRVILTDMGEETAIRSYDIEPDAGETIEKRIRFDL